MIDPVSLIVGALVNGLVAGVEASAQEAVTDGYRSLRDSIAQRYGRRVEASIEQLEREPGSEQRQAAVAWELRHAGAAGDPVLIGLAERLRDLIEHPEKVWAVPDRVEHVQRTSALGVITRVFNDHIGQVLAVRSQYSTKDTDLLTANVARNGDIPAPVRQGLGGLHDRIRLIIEQVAAKIESDRYRDVEDAVANLQAGKLERDFAQRLVVTEKQMQLSYETLRLTVEFLGALNNNIVAAIEREPPQRQLANLMFGNAIMLYELSDFVIGYIGNFSLGGEFDGLHREAKRKAEENREQHRAFAEQVRNKNIPEETRQQYLDRVRERENALKMLDEEWDRYLDEVREVRAKIDRAHDIVPTLELMREDARLQIQTLQQVAMLGVLKQNIASIRGTVDALQGFRLAPMTPTRVRRLLGI
ncbi:hypothetical protein Lesp02_24140 [Lentzea sp. NBRC 105346]|uniref:hypothetical protein n=1 Tax=Lentzea sp. NBRC 105346 TaxID=3032205 RepID=UPI0024A0C2E7|nr:hypothetical protein [Lentzea sp. NBRC 105346]GLZ30224.1 hypothetical protein Lesp02_24140 [Lentzea sp. NBRC 105346]